MRPTPLLSHALKLAAEVEGLRFGAPVAHVYHPLKYAWKAHADYLDKYGQCPKKTLFLGMNPGPFGMMQTGVPFGEVKAVRDWLGIEAQITPPTRQHPKRPIIGFNCSRSEVSGKRLWGLFQSRFHTPGAFFDDHFVVNYCPLVFLEASGRNLTPDKISKSENEPLVEACDRHLKSVIRVTRAEWLVAVGKYALQCLERVDLESSRHRVLCIPHPSPANPTANRDWAGQATRILESQGPWKPTGS